MNFKSVLFLLFVHMISASFAQNERAYVLDFQPKFGSSDLQLENVYYKLGPTDSVRIDILKFYISGVRFLQNDKTVWSEINSFHLVDASKPESAKLLLHIPAGITFNNIKFNIGIDSLTNVSGAMGGDLDPTRGMYWTWQNGYINFKIEGVSNVCQTRRNQFQFHLGGYQSPYSTLQTIVLKAGQNSTAISLDVQKLLYDINLARQNQIMSPGAGAVAVSEHFLSVFSSKAP
jgi:hypothetical protein